MSAGTVRGSLRNAVNARLSDAEQLYGTVLEGGGNWEAAMSDLGARGGRRGLFSGLLEDRFTNVDLVVVLAALVITGLIGALGGVSLVY